MRGVAASSYQVALSGSIRVSGQHARRIAKAIPDNRTLPHYVLRGVAAQRLRDTDDTVGAIAAGVGYRSEYSFSRAFTRHRGIAPGRYRRDARARSLAAA